jgi:P4 family phage/plasmid primase-like protien
MSEIRKPGAGPIAPLADAELNGDMPEGLSEMIMKDLVGRYDVPLINNKLLNEPFWAAYHAAHKAKLLFEPNEGEFYNYDEESGLFKVHSVDVIRKELAALLLQCSRHWGNDALVAKRSARSISGVISHLRGEVEQSDVFVPTGRRIHAANCVLQFNEDRAFTSHDFSPEFYSRNRCPIKYDPDATCPKFRSALLEHLEEGDRELLQKYGGQCLLGRNLTQTILILDGVGGASKGAFVQTTRGIVGSTNAYELRPLHLEDRFEIGRMRGKTLLLGADVKSGFLSGPGAERIKALTGGDFLEAERKTSNKDFFVIGNFNVMITSNSRLQIHLTGDQSAWRRRLLIVRYDKPFNGKMIPNIHEMLISEEGSGILNFYLEGAKKLFRDIQEKGGLTLTDSQRERVDALLSESDSLRIFLREKLVADHKKSDARCSLTVDEIITEYTRYAVDAGWSPVPKGVAQRQLEDLMLELFSVLKSNDIKRGDRQMRGFHNVRFRQDDEE